MKPEEEKLIERVTAAREVENERRVQGGRDRIPGSFEKIADDYEPRRHDSIFGHDADRSYESVTFGQKRYPLQQRDFLDALTVIAMRERRIAELEVELMRERAWREEAKR